MNATDRKAIIGQLAPLISDHVSANLCVAGILHLATRWDGTCTGCGQTIPTGAVGVATWCDERQHNKGSHDYEHGCGAWNAPTEVEVDLSEVDLADIDDAWDRTDAGLDDLAALVTEAKDYAAELTVRRLEVDLAHAILALTMGVDRDDGDAVSDALGHLAGTDREPGVYLEDDGRLVAWDYAPGSDDTIAVTVTRDD